MELNVKFHRTFFPLHFESFTSFWECLNRFQKVMLISEVYIYRKTDSFTLWKLQIKFERILSYLVNLFMSVFTSCVRITVQILMEKSTNLLSRTVFIRLLKQTASCPSYILLKLSGDKLRIDSFDMHHSNLHGNSEMPEEIEGTDKCKYPVTLMNRFRWFISIRFDARFLKILRIAWIFDLWRSFGSDTTVWSGMFLIMIWKL